MIYFYAFQAILIFFSYSEYSIQCKHRPGHPLLQIQKLLYLKKLLCWGELLKRSFLCVVHFCLWIKITPILNEIRDRKLSLSKVVTFIHGISTYFWYLFLLRRLLTTAAMIFVNSSRWSLKSILTKEFSSTSCFGSSNNTFIFWCMRTKFLLAYNIIILCDKDPCP